MKKGVLILLLMFSISFVAAEACDVSVTLLNQDPYPAVPGDYVKLVFQIDNIDNPECGEMIFSLNEDYPIEFDPTEDGIRTIQDVNYVKDYQSNILIPYEVRVNENALDGSNPIEANIKHKGQAPITETFNIEVDDVRADFEIYVKDYDYTTNEVTIEVLNIEESDIEALTVEIPKQGAIEIKGANKIVVGDLDSNEYTTADFEAKISDGEFKVNLIYSDTINTRRTLEKMVSYDSSYFTDRKADQKTTSKTTYVVWLVIILLAIWWIVKKFTKKKKK